MLGLNSGVQVREASRHAYRQFGAVTLRYKWLTRASILPSYAPQMSVDDSAKEPVGTDGILVISGSTFGIRDLKIWADTDGELQTSMRPQIGWEMWPLWVRVAVEHESQARTARIAIRAAADDHARSSALTDETRAGMVAVSACAFALEAMSRSAARLAGMDGVGRNGTPVPDDVSQRFSASALSSRQARSPVGEEG